MQPNQSTEPIQPNTEQPHEQFVSEFPAVPVDGAIYMTPPMHERGTPEWKALDLDVREAEMDRRIDLVRATSAASSIGMTGLKNEVQTLHTEKAELEEVKDALAKAANTDELTGLHNLRSFTKELEEKLKSNTPIVVLFLDLDNFKTVNDMKGHEAGDILLKAVADRVQQAANLRTGETICRIGGDEFAVIAKENVDGNKRRGKYTPEQLIENLTTKFKADVKAVGIELKVPFVGVSIGGAIPRAGDTVETIKARADEAMYKDKANRVAYR